MNTLMNNKYYKMHTEVLDICESSGIRMIPGRRPAYEILMDRGYEGIKEFILTPEDMEVFYEKCEGELKSRGYKVVRGKLRGHEICRIYGEDMFASAVSTLMSNPSGRHCPQFVVRRMTVEGAECSYASTGKDVTFGAEALEGLEKTEYMGSTVYAEKDLRAHLKDICGVEDPDGLTMNKYALFSTEVPAADFLREAEKRGYLSEERISRYNEYTEWRKENRTENERKFKEYQQVLLSLKQPE